MVMDNLIFENLDKYIDLKKKYHSDVDIDENGIKRIYNLLKEKNILSTYFFTWLLKISKHNKRFFEDLLETVEYLSFFEKNKKEILKMGNPIELYKQGSGELIYKNKTDLYNVIKPFLEVSGGSRIEKAKGLISRLHAEFIYEDESWFIVVPKTYLASKILACDTNWCTRFPQNFINYSQKGKLYILIRKDLEESNKPDRVLQFHFNSEQFMDIEDKPIDIVEFFNEWTEIFDVLLPVVVQDVREGKEVDDEYLRIMPDVYLDIYRKTHQIEQTKDPIIIALSQNTGIDPIRIVLTYKFGNKSFYTISNREYEVLPYDYAFYEAKDKVREEFDMHGYLNEDNIYELSDFINHQSFFEDEKSQLEEQLKNIQDNFDEDEESYQEQSYEIEQKIKDLEYYELRDNSIGYVERILSEDAESILMPYVNFKDYKDYVVDSEIEYNGIENYIEGFDLGKVEGKRYFAKLVT